MGKCGLGTGAFGKTAEDASRVGGMDSHDHGGRLLKLYAPGQRWRGGSSLSTSFRMATRYEVFQGMAIWRPSASWIHPRNANVVSWMEGRHPRARARWGCPGLSDRRRQLVVARVESPGRARMAPCFVPMTTGVARVYPAARLWASHRNYPDAAG